MLRAEFMTHTSLLQLLYYLQMFKKKDDL